MSEDAHILTRLTQQQVQRLATWGIFFAVLFAFSWHKSRENRRDQLAMARWNREQGEFGRNSRMEMMNMGELLRSYLGKPRSQKELERQLNARQPFDVRREENRDVTEWAHPYYAFGFRLEFENGVLRGSASNRGDPANFRDRTRAPTWPAWSGITEAWRQQIVRISGLGWLTAFAAWCVMRRWRLILTQILLATALTFFYTSIVHPGYSIADGGLMSNDSIGFGALMLIYTVYLLGVTLALDSNVQLSISQIRFRLRDLLIVVTIVAGLLAVGPLGYVTLLVVLAGVMLFVAVFNHYRSRLAVQRS
jgi:hypothetical protein